MQIEFKVICFADNIWQIALFASDRYLSRVDIPPWMCCNVHSSFHSFSHIKKSNGTHFLFDWIAWPRQIELNNFEIWIVETISISGKTIVINTQTKNNQLNANGFTFLFANLFMCIANNRIYSMKCVDETLVLPLTWAEWSSSCLSFKFQKC